MFKFFRENWSWIISVTVTIAVLTFTWFLYNDNIKKIKDSTIVECNTQKIEEELAAEKARSKELELRTVELRAILAEKEAQLKTVPPFIEKIRTVTITLPDEKLAEGAAEVLELLNQRAANVK